jgi:hypothetical protein
VNRVGRGDLLSEIHFTPCGACVELAIHVAALCMFGSISS